MENNNPLQEARNWVESNKEFYGLSIPTALQPYIDASRAEAFMAGIDWQKEQNKPLIAELSEVINRLIQKL